METKKLPQYQSHKVVGALKIKSIEPNGETGTSIITPEEEGFEPFEVGKDYLEKHNPQVGGYYVEYEEFPKFDPRFSSAEFFESGYKKVQDESTTGSKTTEDFKEHEHDFSIVKGCEEKYCRICDLAEADYLAQQSVTQTKEVAQMDTKPATPKSTSTRKRRLTKKTTDKPVETSVKSKSEEAKQPTEKPVEAAKSNVQKNTESKKPKK